MGTLSQSLFIPLITRCPLAWSVRLGEGTSPLRRTGGRDSEIAPKWDAKRVVVGTCNASLL